MSEFLGKLSFVHRRLWRDDGVYRAAFLFGPAALVGCSLAFGLWETSVILQNTTSEPPAWAVRRSTTWDAAADRPNIVRPDRPLPPAGPNGEWIGYEPGWQVTLNPIEVDALMDADVKPSPVKAFNFDGPTVDMERIVSEAPKGDLYAALGSNFLVVKKAGVYALTAQFKRPAAPQANCLMRLAFGPHRIVAAVVESIVADFSKTFDAPRFELQPGLYRTGWTFTCWHDREPVGPGRLTLLVRHPDEDALAPARPDDIVGPERLKP
jgi:hypothetical protein